MVPDSQDEQFWKVSHYIVFSPEENASYFPFYWNLSLVSHIIYVMFNQTKKLGHSKRSNGQVSLNNKYKNTEIIRIMIMLTSKWRLSNWDWCYIDQMWTIRTNIKVNQSKLKVNTSSLSVVNQHSNYVPLFWTCANIISKITATPS